MCFRALFPHFDDSPFRCQLGRVKNGGPISRDPSSSSRDPSWKTGRPDIRIHPIPVSATDSDRDNVSCARALNGRSAEITSVNQWLTCIASLGALDTDAFPQVCLLFRIRPAL
jgi:hypothetical protein